MAGNDSHWIEHAKLKRGAYGHHSAAQRDKDAKKSGKKGKRARLANTLIHLNRQQHHAQKLYGGK